MRKISDIIYETIVRQPFLEEALHHGYLNLTGFAEHIRSHVEKEAMKEVSVHAIKMALSRMERPQLLSPYSIRPAQSQISTISGLGLMSVLRSPGAQEAVSKLHAMKRGGLNTYMAIIEGSREIDILYDIGFSEFVESNFPEELRILAMSELSLCSLHLRDEEIEQKGLFYSVTKKLAFHGINIIQVISTYHELGVVVRDEDLKKTVTALLG